MARWWLRFNRPRNTIALSGGGHVGPDGGDYGNDNGTVEESNKIVTEEDGSNMDSTTKSRTLPTNTEVVGIKKIQNEKAHIRSEVENPNTGVRVSKYFVQYSIVVY